MAKRIIIVSPKQYGYQTDYVKYVEYLAQRYRVVFLCLDQGEKRIPCDNAAIIYLRFLCKKASYAWFLLYTIIYLAFHSGKIMTSNFNNCKLLPKILFWRKIAINIRTVSVEKNPATALAQNKRIKADAIAFHRIIMISKGGAEQLELPMEKVDIVALGADPISQKQKQYTPLRLLYLGTLTNRDILKTVQGFQEYIRITGDRTATYDIVGDGEERKKLSEYILGSGLEAQVHMHGWVHYTQVKPFFDSCNIGVAFVPINDSYKYQPPTKTFEYMNSGLYVIATANPVHQELITDECGIIIQDTATDFGNALITLAKRKIDEKNIRKCGKPYLWSNIVYNQLVNSLEKL